MKKIKLLIFLLLNIMAPSVYAQNNNPAKNPSHKIKTFFTNLQNIAYQTPLFAGWHSTAAQKEKALAIIEQLNHEKLELEEQFSHADLASEKIELTKQINALDDQINEQKIITGDRWSNARYAIWTTGIIGMTAIGTMPAYSKKSTQQKPTNVPSQNPQEINKPSQNSQEVNKLIQERNEILRKQEDFFAHDQRLQGSYLDRICRGSQELLTIMKPNAKDTQDVLLCKLSSISKQIETMDIYKQRSTLHAEYANTKDALEAYANLCNTKSAIKSMLKPTQ